MKLPQTSLLFDPFTALLGTVRLFAEFARSPTFALEAEAGGGIVLINTISGLDWSTWRVGGYANWYLLGDVATGFYLGVGPKYVATFGFEDPKWKRQIEPDIIAGPSHALHLLAKFGGKYTRESGLTFRAFLGLGGQLSYLRDFRGETWDWYPAWAFDLGLNAGYSF